VLKRVLGSRGGSVRYRVRTGRSDRNGIESIGGVRGEEGLRVRKEEKRGRMTMVKRGQKAK
jgi:hypothetical protein